MNVCIVTDSFPPDLGGIATFYGNLAELLAQQKHHVIVVMADRNAKANDDDTTITNGSITKVILKKSYSQRFHYYRQFFRPGGLNAPSWIALGVSIREWLLQNHKLLNIDIIDVIDFGGLGAFCLDHQLPPVVITGHGSLTQYSKINHTKKDAHYKLITELEKLSFLHADLVLAYSPLNQKDLEKVFSRSIDFSPAPWIHSKPEGFSISTNGKPLVVAGFQKIKGAELLCEALAIAVSRNAELKCEWVGMEFYTAPGGRPMSDFLEKRFPSLWDTHFLWLDSLEREDTIHKIASAAFIIVPSIFETFNYVSVEAATLGKAILITEGTGASYLFTHNENAWIVSPEPSKIAEGIVQLNKDPELCARLGRNAQKMIKKVLDLDKIYQDRMNSYQMAIDYRKKIVPKPDLKLIEKYLTNRRRLYYKTRAFLKKLVKNS